MADFNWPNVVLAATIPFASVYFAQWLAGKNTHRFAIRQSALEAFRQVDRHRQEFINTYMDLRQTKFSLESIRGSDPSHMQTDGHRDDFHRFGLALRAKTIDLESDCRLLNLLFDEEASSLIVMLRKWIWISKWLVEYDPVPPHPRTCLKQLNDEFMAMSEEIGRLWRIYGRLRPAGLDRATSEAPPVDQEWVNRWRKVPTAANNGPFL